MGNVALGAASTGRGGTEDMDKAAGHDGNVDLSSVIPSHHQPAMESSSHLLLPLPWDGRDPAKGWEHSADGGDDI